LKPSQTCMSSESPEETHTVSASTCQCIRHKRAGRQM
jgi:hypothetical protein